MKKINWIALLLSLSLVVCAPLSALAAPGDASAFVQPEDPNLSSAEPAAYYAAQIVLLDGTFYALAYPNDPAEKPYVLRWTQDMDAPEKFCDLPEMNTSYYDSYEQAPPETKALLDNTVQHIAAGDGKLWAFNANAGRLGEITAQGVQWLDVPLDMTDMRVMEGGDIQRLRERSVTYPMVMDGALYCLRDNYSDDSWSDNRVLMRWDITTGAQTQMLTQSAQMIAPYKPGQLLTYGRLPEEETGNPIESFTALDLASGQETSLPLAVAEERTGWDAIGGLAYDAETDSIYFLKNKQIWRSEKGSPPAAVAYLTQVNFGDNSPAWILPGGLYAVGAMGLYIRNVDPQYMPTRALRINGGWEDANYRAFAFEHPDIPVLFDINYLGEGEQIAAAISGGDTQTDIFILYAQNGLRALIDKGFTAELSTSAILSEDVARMYPQIQQAISSADGKLMAYPRSIDYQPWTVDMALWEQFDMGPLPTTYAQFFDYMARWQQEYAEDNAEFAFLDATYDGRGLADVVLRNYILQSSQTGEPIDFTAPVLREVFEKIEALDLEEIDTSKMTEQDWEEFNELRNRRTIFTMYGRGGLFYNPDSTQYTSGDGAWMSIPPMVFEEGQQPAIPATIEVLMVNPASVNIDLAMQYIEFSAQKGSDNYLRYALHPDLNEPVELANFAQSVQSMNDWRNELAQRMEAAVGAEQLDLKDQLDYTDRWLADQEKNKWEISPKAIENYRALATYMTLADDSILLSRETGGGMEILMELLSRYTSGQMPLDSFLRELDGKMRMIYLEGQ